MSYWQQNTIGAMFRRSVVILRSEGARSFWFKLLGETGFRRMDLIERKICPSPDREAAAKNVQVVQLTADDVDEFLRFRDYANREAVLGRLAAGHRCFLVREAGDIVHCCWTATGRAYVDYLACDIRLQNDAVYVYDAYTAPHRRGASISSLRSREMGNYFYERGYRRLLALIWPENKSPYRSAEKAGYTVIGRMGYLGTGRLRRYFIHCDQTEAPLQLVDTPHARAPGYGTTYWDHVPDHFDGRSHYLDPFMAVLKRRENLRLVRDWGGLRPDGRLLKTDAFEEAMGTDAFLAELQGEVAEIVGMDISSMIVRRAAERNLDNAIQFLVADVRRLPFANACFSTVTSPSTLDHFADPNDLGVCLRELFRVIEPGGRLVITLDNRQNLFDPLLRLVNRLGMLPYFVGRSYTVDDLRRELNSAGFIVQETSAILHNPRLMAIAMMRVVRWLRWAPLIRAAERLLLAAQGLKNTRMCYYTGSFVAALAIRPQADAAYGEPE